VAGQLGNLDGTLRNCASAKDRALVVVRNVLDPGVSVLLPWFPPAAFVNGGLLLLLLVSLLLSIWAILLVVVGVVRVWVVTVVLAQASAQLALVSSVDLPILPLLSGLGGSGKECNCEE